MSENAPLTPKLLLVEPDRDIRECLVEMLGEAGFDVRAARSEAEAATVVEEDTFGLILADLGPLELHLERMLELRRAVFPTPVGLVSSRVAGTAHAVGDGFAFNLAKPFAWEDLLAAIADTLRVPMTAEEQARASVIARYYQCLGDRRWEDLAALCTEDVRYALPGEGTFGRALEGRDAFLAFTRETFAQFADARFTDVIVRALPRGLVTRYTARWRTSHGSVVAQAGAVAFRFRGLQISEIGVRLDTSRLRRLMREQPTGGPGPESPSGASA